MVMPNFDLLKNLTMLNRLLLFCILFTLLISCSQPSENQSSAAESAETTVEKETKLEEEVTQEAPKASIGDNSQNALDWPGTYFATLPCGHCEGIETWVTLKIDGTFVLKTHHMGLNDDREEIFTGKFTWDDSGSIVTFHGLIGGAPGKYKVGENRIWHLDENGRQITGDLADRYILQKSSAI
jgi:uncharacterized lipoprotein NlpE involved in copper resistance